MGFNIITTLLHRCVEDGCDFLSAYCSRHSSHFFQINNDVTRHAPCWCIQQGSAPREPSAEAIVAVVAVTANTQLEALVFAYRHVAQGDQVTGVFALTDHVALVALQGVNGFDIRFTSEGHQVAVGRVFCFPLRSILTSFEGHEDVKALIRIAVADD